MPLRRDVQLTPAQREELCQARDHAPVAYLRERAAAILKVADGQSVRQVAEQGLLQRHEPETVGEWITRYQAQGLAGLRVRAGRGRKPAYFPPQS